MTSDNQAETVRVIVRCRPMNKRENDLKCATITGMSGCQVSLTNPTDTNCPPKQFTFDAVYDQNSNTESVYNDICYPLIESVLEGYNATVFAYGQTGCGKSFTMEGPPRSSVPSDTFADNNAQNQRPISTPTDALRGIIPRSFDHIFEAISVATDVKYLALVSYVEIYNEQIRDLLVPANKFTSNTGLALKEIPNQGVVIQGLTTHPVHNVKECEDLLKLGSKNRIIGATLMNQNSSRSHSIFTINLEQIQKDEQAESMDDNHIRKGKLNLVDLAGSERQSKTGAVGERLKEATKINLSLSALGNVISALVDGKSMHIPYRDSKLTRLLQDSLGGNTKTLMVACISPADNNYDETLSTLRYANRAKNICNKPVINEDPKDAMLRKYQEEIQKLRELLESANVPSSGIPGFSSTELNNNDPSQPDAELLRDRLNEERNKIVHEYETQVMGLRNEHASEKSQKENLMQEMERLKREYQESMEKVNQQILENEQAKLSKPTVTKDDILKRLETIKHSLIGGEKANDEKLKEKRKRKKLAAEKRLNALAQVLARVEQEEDREILQDQYKDIAQALSSKTESMKKYKHKVRALEREIKDIQEEFETERGDYLETIRRHERFLLLYQQISDKIIGQIKRECNYCNIDSIKDQAIWCDDTQNWKLPDVVYSRTKLPPAGRTNSSQTAPARLELLDDEITYNDCNNNDVVAMDYLESPDSPPAGDKLIKKLERSLEDDICGNYFKPRRATKLLQSQSTASDDGSLETSHRAFNHWKDSQIPELAFKAKDRPSFEATEDNVRNSPLYSQPWNGFGFGNPDIVLTGRGSPPNGFTDHRIGRPIRLESLPSLERRKKPQLNKLDVI